MATAEYPADAWERLGFALETRRVKMGYKTVAAFFRARRAYGSPDAQVLRKIEKNKRENFDRSTLTRIEVAYGLEERAIARFLSGEVAVLLVEGESASPGAKLREALAMKGLDVEDVRQAIRTLSLVADLAESADGTPGELAECGRRAAG
jgi:allophanate hydrolase subunit 1